MTTAETLLRAFDIEIASTRSILEHTPTGKSNWTPHPRSMPLDQLTMHIATLPGMATSILTTTSFDLAAGLPFSPILAADVLPLPIFDAGVTSARSALAESNDDHLSQLWTLRHGPRIFVQSPRSVAMVHNFLGHLIHHRAQLGMYLRLNDLYVPGMYGPSANDKEAFQQTPNKDTP